MVKNLSSRQIIPVINLFNRQRKVRLEPGPLREFLGQLAARLQLEKSFSVVLVSNRRMKEFNRDFAGKDYATDVLSFPCDDSGMDEGYLGDIVISAEKALEQAAKSLDNELRVLALHGVLHLMGFDHEKDRGRMARMENELRRELNLLKI